MSSSSSIPESDRARILDEFASMTGTGEEFAISFLDASDWNLEQAMELFLGGQGGVAQAPRGNSSSPSAEDESEAQIRRIMSQHEVDRETAIAIRDAGGAGDASAAGGSLDADGVRAPILQKRARLFDFDHGEEDEEVEEHLSHDLSGLHFANAFEAQLRLARQVMQQESAVAPQRASMFAPPRWMMFLGSFEDARAEAKEKKRWILVNIQDETEFQSLVLNRDLWADETTQSLVNGSFLFWQHDRNSAEAQRFITLYNPERPFPHVCIIDPRTGERLKILKLKKREHDLRETFFEQVTEFLDVHSFESKFKAPSSGGSFNQTKSAPPPTASLKSAEDEQMEEAIRASLAFVDSASSALKPVPAPAPSAPSAPAEQFLPLTLEPPAGPDSTTVQFKFPDGTRAKRRFLKGDVVSMLFSYIVDSKKVPAGARFDLMTSDIPARSLLGNLDKNLVDADACNQNLLVRML